MIQKGDGTFAKRIKDGKCPNCKTGFSFVHSHDQGDYWECPTCKHQNHWAVPEDVLNQMGWVTHENDDRVISERVEEKDCNQFAEACKKKKVVV